MSLKDLIRVPHIQRTHKRISGLLQNRFFAYPFTPPKKLFTIRNQIIISFYKRADKKTGYSYPHANRVFIQETGMSLFHYFKEQKINYAKKLLANTDYTLEIIAEKTGYSSSYAFSASFKKLVGVSPADYAKNNKSSYGLNDVE
ncbi:MAG: helix-turn-helix domain-containing protein [Candidatus Scatosoma sp.]